MCSADVVGSVASTRGVGDARPLVAIDQLLDDPGFFEPFRRHVDPVFGRPTIPIETYLRLMFLKYRYRLGNETLCAEVTDSLTCCGSVASPRIPLVESAPHPSTLMKITTRCGSVTVDELNAQLIAVGVEAGVIDMGWLRADTTVVPADIRYPTDSGLSTKGAARIATVVSRVRASPPRTGIEDRTVDARQGAHRIASKLRRRSDDARADVLSITGELADLAETAVVQAKRVLVNARRVSDRPVRRLRQMLADLAHLIDAVTQVIAQTRLRLAGEIPPGKTRRVLLHDGDARPIRKGSLATPTQFGYTAKVTDTRDGIVVDYEIQAGMPPNAPRLAPAIERAITATGLVPDAITADRGYRQVSVVNDLADLGVDLVAILRKGKPGAARQQVKADPTFLEMVKWRTGAEARIAPLKRQHSWGRARLRTLEGARTWCGWGILCHNAIKIAALSH